MTVHSHKDNSAVTKKIMFNSGDTLALAMRTVADKFNISATSNVDEFLDKYVLYKPAKTEDDIPIYMTEKLRSLYSYLLIDNVCYIYFILYIRTHWRRVSSHHPVS